MERRGTLLIVEDEDILRQLVAQFLRIEGYEVVEAADGEDGLRRFEDSGPFDLLLVDLNMPILPGVEVCRRVKRVDPGQKILICSAAIGPDHEVALRAIGVEHFLTKPYPPESLLARVRMEIGRRPSPAPHPAYRPMPLFHPGPLA